MLSKKNPMAYSSGLSRDSASAAATVPVPHPHAVPRVDCNAPLSLSEWLLNSRCNDRILIRSGSISGGETRTRLGPPPTIYLGHYPKGLMCGQDASIFIVASPLYVQMGFVF